VAARDLIFSTTVKTGPEAHPVFYAINTGTLPVVKWPGLGVDHPYPI